MGGHAAGEVAARITVETIGEFIAATRQKEEATWPFKYDHSLDFNSNRLAIAIEKANERVMAAVAAQPWLKGMGTTVVAGLLNEKMLSLAHVGDSRAYMYREGQAAAPDRRPLLGARAGGGGHPDRRRSQVASAEECRHQGPRRRRLRCAGPAGASLFGAGPIPLLLGRADDDALRRGDRRARRPGTKTLRSSAGRSWTSPTKRAEWTTSRSSSPGCSIPPSPRSRRSSRGGFAVPFLGLAATRRPSAP